MIRTQVYLPQSQIKYLKDLAHANRTTMSEELRKKLNLTVKVKKDNQSLPEILANGKTNWFDVQAEKEIAKNRKQIEQRIKKWGL